MLSRGLIRELQYLALIAVGAIIIGVARDQVLGFLCFGLAGFILWLLLRLAVLEKWITEARRHQPPPDDFGGIWSEIADDVRLLCRRYEKDKLRLQAVVIRVQEMTSALADAVVLVDQRANIEWWNRAAANLVRFKDIDRGHKLVNIIRDPRFFEYFEGRRFDQPLQLMSPWREDQHLEFHVHTFGEGDRLVIIRDVTRMRRLEQMRKDFVSNVSHELRTPLTVIRGYIETLFDSPEAPPKWRKALDQMNVQSRRMTALINDLITLSRLETAETEEEPKPIAVCLLLERVVSEAQALASNKHHLIVDCASDIELLGNERELHSAFSNLVVNAVKYSPEGGEIRVAYKALNSGASIVVTDQGLGIDSKHLPRVTERFYRVDEGRSSEAGGTGLGLAIVKHVLARHEGELKVSSHLGKGSTFSCHFPKERWGSRQTGLAS